MSDATKRQVVRAMVHGSVVRTIGPLSADYARDVALNLVEAGYYVEREDVEESELVAS